MGKPNYLDKLTRLNNGLLIIWGKYQGIQSQLKRGLTLWRCTWWNVEDMLKVLGRRIQDDRECWNLKETFIFKKWTVTCWLNGQLACIPLRRSELDSSRAWSGPLCLFFNLLGVKYVGTMVSGSTRATMVPVAWVQFPSTSLLCFFNR